MRLPSAGRWVSILVAMTLHFAGNAGWGMDGTDPDVHTFSIVAFDPVAKEFGVGVASRYLAAGSVVPWAEAEVGAIATQAMAKSSFGPRGLQLLKEGKPAAEVLEELLASDPKSATRQVAVIDSTGSVAVHTGEECMAWAGHKTGERYSVQGNLLEGPEVVAAMAEAFEAARKVGHSELAD